MIPFRTSVDAHRSPVMTMTLIVINVSVFFIQLGMTPEQHLRFLYQYALVPAVYGAPEAARAAGLDPHNYLPLITNTFLHGGFLHIIFNMWMLWLFGVPLEDRLGPWRFLLFYLAAGTAGSLTHLGFNLYSTVPALGASGAIAGVLGGFTWLFPRAKVSVVIPIIIVPLILQWPALVFTALWLTLQVIQGTAALGADPATGGIAWWAHIGGFAAGLAIAVWLRAGRRRGPWGS
ncbi:MAG: rhomboid family intramembrane serine protease [Rhodospirillales bacterium]|nr:MAG: rhomboid family intramembrane serine protease [Rhodospirillales bacterium]